MSKVSKKSKKVDVSKEMGKKVEDRVVREDVLLNDKKVDLKKVPTNNADCNRLDRRFLYAKTGNYVVYGRMIQLKRKEGYWLENDVIRCKDDGYEGGTK